MSQTPVRILTKQHARSQGYRSAPYGKLGRLRHNKTNVKHNDRTRDDRKQRKFITAWNNERAYTPNENGDYSVLDSKYSKVFRETYSKTCFYLCRATYFVFSFPSNKQHIPCSLPPSKPPQFQLKLAAVSFLLLHFPLTPRDWITRSWSSAFLFSGRPPLILPCGF